jgi:hypothetical protein
MKRIYLALLITLSAAAVFAESKPLQFSLTPEIASQPRFMLIEGLCLNIWGENEQRAFALGFINGSIGDSVGVSLGLLNYAENYKGAHLGFVNYTGGQFGGIQCGWLFGFGAINYAGQLTGLQLGLVNYAESAENGIQIGILNIINQTPGWFDNFPNEIAPGMVIVNWSL